MATASHLSTKSPFQTILYPAALAVIGASLTWWTCSSSTGPEQPQVQDPEPTHPIVGVWRYVGDNVTAGLQDRATTCQITEEELDTGKVARNVDYLMFQSELYGLQYSTITFRTDGTFDAPPRIIKRQLPAESGAVNNDFLDEAWTGTWLVSGMQLILFTDEPPISRSQRTTITFKVLEDRLELSIPVQDFIQHLKPIPISTSGDPTKVFDVGVEELGVSDECIATAMVGIERVTFSYQKS